MKKILILLFLVPFLVQGQRRVDIKLPTFDPAPYKKAYYKIGQAPDSSYATITSIDGLQIDTISFTGISSILSPSKIIYGSFYSKSNQPSIAAPQLITIDSTYSANGITISSSRINIATPGKYQFNYNASIQYTTEISIWAKLNGVDISNSGAMAFATGEGSTQATGNSFILNLAAGDYIEFYYLSAAGSLATTTNVPSFATTVVKLEDPVQGLSSAPISTVWGTFARTTNLITTATDQPITMDLTSSASGMTLSGSQISVASAGRYAFAITAETSNNRPDTIFPKINGVELPNSRIFNYNFGDGANQLASTTYTLDLNSGDYVEFFVNGGNTGGGLRAYPNTPSFRVDAYKINSLTNVVSPLPRTIAQFIDSIPPTSGVNGDTTTVFTYHVPNDGKVHQYHWYLFQSVSSGYHGRYNSYSVLPDGTPFYVNNSMYPYNISSQITYDLLCAPNTNIVISSGLDVGPYLIKNYFTLIEIAQW